MTDGVGWFLSIFFSPADTGFSPHTSSQGSKISLQRCRHRWTNRKKKNALCYAHTFFFFFVVLASSACRPHLQLRHAQTCAVPLGDEEHECKCRLVTMREVDRQMMSGVVFPLLTLAQAYWHDMWDNLAF